VKNNAVPLSQRIVILPLVLIAAFIVIGVVSIDIRFNRIAVERYEKDLARLAHSGAQMIDIVGTNAELDSFDKFADSFAENGRFRVTIIDSSGTVLGDSQLSPQEIRQIENHGERPEIVAARETGIGSSIRYSSTLNVDLLYVAVRFNSRNQKRYFRVALPLADLKQDEMRQRMVLGGFGIASLLIATFLSILISRHLLTLVKEGKLDLERRVLERTKEIEILQNLGTQLTACNSKEEALEVIKIVTSILLPRFCGTLALFRSSKDTLEIVQTWNGIWQGKANYTHDECWSLRIGQAHLGDPDSGNMRCSHSRDQAEQMLCLPLIAQGVTHGVLHFSSLIKTEWKPEEKQLAAAVAEHASLTLASLELRETLRQQAIRDPLTGLYNRRYLLETMEHELGRASRRNQNLGLLMIDLDHFKKFNDEYGHDTGDFILSELGRLLRMTIRTEDVPCRYGGEEFIILLPETNRDNVFFVAEKIASTIREHAFLFGNRSFGPITLSIGVATFPQNGQTAEHLFKQADQALYKAKKNGRNRVMFAESTL